MLVDFVGDESRSVGALRRCSRRRQRSACVFAAVLTAGTVSACYRYSAVDGGQQTAYSLNEASQRGSGSSAAIAEHDLTVRLRQKLASIKNERAQLHAQRDPPSPAALVGAAGVKRAEEVSVSPAVAASPESVSESVATQTPPPPPPQPVLPNHSGGEALQTGQTVMAPWLGLRGPGRDPHQFYEATVLSTSTMEAQVHYSAFGGGERFDSWVPKNAVRPVITSASPDGHEEVQQRSTDKPKMQAASQPETPPPSHPFPPPPPPPPPPPAAAGASTTTVKGLGGDGSSPGQQQVVLQPDDKDMLRREQLVAAGKARDDGRCGERYPTSPTSDGMPAICSDVPGSGEFGVDCSVRGWCDDFEKIGRGTFQTIDAEPPCTESEVAEAAAAMPQVPQAGPALAWCLPVIYNLDQLNVGQVAAWHRYHRTAMGVGRVYVHVFEREARFVHEGELARRFFSRDDVEVEIRPDCPHCAGKEYADCPVDWCSQKWAIKHCFQRAKAEGVRWAVSPSAPCIQVFGDLDEFVTTHPLETAYADQPPPSAPYPNDGDSDIAHKDISLLELLKGPQLSRYSAVSFGKLAFDMNVCQHPSTADSAGGTASQHSGLNENLASWLPCRVNGPQCMTKACMGEAESCHPAHAATCPTRGCNAAECTGWGARRKHVLQLPLRTNVLDVHGDVEMTTSTGSSASTKCSHSYLITSTNLARMYEWRAIMSNAKLDQYKQAVSPGLQQDGTACAEESGGGGCPAGHVRDTFMRAWEQRHPPTEA